MERILTVSELTANIKALLETSFGTLWVAGEVSNLRQPGSGHFYFTLKDENSQMRAVMFRQSAAALGFSLEEGISIVCRGRLTVYTARGDCQLVVDGAEPRGIGALQVAFEQLRRRLDEEGLFDPARKRKLPRFPRKVGIVTSPSGAAVRDIMTVMGRRWPSCDILIAPVRVQGTEAASEICRALDMLNRVGDIDVIIVARGGGSIEDLCSFNDERVARAIHGSRIPVVSAVGHEIDFTIADFVADVRAPTPSAAAELVVPDRRATAECVTMVASRLVAADRACRQGLSRRLNNARDRLVDPAGGIADLRIFLDDQVAHLAEGFLRDLEKRRNRVESLARSLRNLNPGNRIRESRRAVQYLANKTLLHVGYRRGHARSRVDRAMAVLDSMSPLAVLKRGYSITRHCSDGSPVRDTATLQKGEALSVRVMSGSFHTRVTHIIQEVSRGGKEI